MQVDVLEMYPKKKFHFDDTGCDHVASFEEISPYGDGYCKSCDRHYVKCSGCGYHIPPAFCGPQSGFNVFCKDCSTVLDLRGGY